MQIPSPADTVSEDQILFVQSRGWPALRYAAAGFYSCAGQEVQISGVFSFARSHNLIVRGIYFGISFVIKYRRRLSVSRFRVSR